MCSLAQLRFNTPAGGDAFLSECIMRAGYGFTDPGYSFYHWEAKSFDPGPEISRKLVQDFSEAVLSTCDSATLVSFAWPA